MLYIYFQLASQIANRLSSNQSSSSSDENEKDSASLEKYEKYAKYKRHHRSKQNINPSQTNEDISAGAPPIVTR